MDDRSKTPGPLMRLMTESADHSMPSPEPKDAVLPRAGARARAIAIGLVILGFSAPALISLLSVGNLGSAKIFESTVFGADYGRFFEEVLHGHSLWMWGQYQTNGVNYLPLYSLLYALEFVLGSGSLGYHASLLIFQLSALVCFVAFFRDWQSRIVAESGGDAPLLY